MSDNDSELVVVFAFKIMENVRLKGLKVDGSVLARCDRGTYREYRVEYWYNGEQRDQWILECDLTEVQ